MFLPFDTHEISRHHLQARKARARNTVARELGWFRKHGYKIYLDQETAQYIDGEEVVSRQSLAARHPDFALVLGGDGTLLSAARAIAHEDIPIRQ